MKQYEIDYLYKCAEGKAGPLSEERIAEHKSRLAEHRVANGGHERLISSMSVETIENGTKRPVLRFTIKPEAIPLESGDPVEIIRLLREDLENEGA